MEIKEEEQESTLGTIPVKEPRRSVESPDSKPQDIKHEIEEEGQCEKWDSTAANICTFSWTTTPEAMLIDLQYRDGECRKIQCLMDGLLVEDISEDNVLNAPHPSYNHATEIAELDVPDVVEEAITHFLRGPNFPDLTSPDQLRRLRERADDAIAQIKFTRAPQIPKDASPSLQEVVQDINEGGETFLSGAAKNHPVIEYSQVLFVDKWTMEIEDFCGQMGIRNCSESWLGRRHRPCSCEGQRCVKFADLIRHWEYHTKFTIITNALG